MSKKRIAIVRGKHFNLYEAQSFERLTTHYDVVGFISLAPIHSTYSFPTENFLSPVDVVSMLQKAGISPRISMGILNRLFVDAHMLLGLEKALKGFSIAHTAETYMHFTHQALTAKRRGFVQKVVSTVWETIPGNNEGIRGRKKFKQLAIAQVDHFIATTKRAKDVLIQEGCNAKRISVIYPGINCTQFPYKKKQKTKVTQLLFVGRLEKEKGVWDIFDAFVQIAPKYPKLTLKLVGAGSQRNKLKYAIAKEKLSTRVTVEAVPYSKIPNKYRDADICILASKKTTHWEEQFGMVLIEAMASGVPVVVTKCGAIPEVVGNAGVLIEGGTRLSKAIENLIHNQAKRVSLAKKGRARVEKLFNAEKTNKKISNVYEELLNTQHN